MSGPIGDDTALASLLKQLGSAFQQLWKEAYFFLQLELNSIYMGFTSQSAAHSKEQ